MRCNQLQMCPLGLNDLLRHSGTERTLWSRCLDWTEGHKAWTQTAWRQSPVFFQTFTPDADDPMRRLQNISNHSDWLWPDWAKSLSVMMEWRLAVPHWLYSQNKANTDNWYKSSKFFLTFCTFLCDLIFQEFFSRRFELILRFKSLQKTSKKYIC